MIEQCNTDLGSSTPFLYPPFSPPSQSPSSSPHVCFENLDNISFEIKKPFNIILIAKFQIPYDQTEKKMRRRCSKKCSWSIRRIR